MSRFLASEYRPLVPYTPGEQPKDKRYIKLNTNESPFPPSPRVSQVLNEDKIRDLNLYSDPTLSELTEAIANALGVCTQNIFCGNGSDDVLAFSIMAFCGRGGQLVCPDISYSFYPVFAQLFGVNLTQIPLREDFTVGIQDYIGLKKNIVIANPNAPTGLALPASELERIIASNPDNVVIIDEAYVDFAQESCVPLVKKYDNLLVTQTFSKSRSLAGLRVGYAVGSEALIADLNKIRYSFNPYNLNSLSIAAASAAIADRAYYDRCVREVVRVREQTKSALARLGFDVLDSRTNFVFARHPKKDARLLYEALKENGVLVRYFDQPRIDGWLRISVGSEEQMRAMLTILEGLI